MWRSYLRSAPPLLAAGLLALNAVLPAAAQPARQQEPDGPTVVVSEEGTTVGTGGESVPGPSVPGSDQPSGIGIDSAADPSQAALESCQMMAQGSQDCQ